MFELASSMQMQFVFGLIITASLLMASNRVRYDTIALGVVLALMLSGVLSVKDSLAGFGNSVVITIAGLLVIGEMLDRTGVARSVGDWILTKGGNNETKLLVLIMLAGAILGAVMSSTAIVAILIPVILRISSRTDINSSRLLMPMSFGALISGMLTLIGTPPNLVISQELQKSGFQPLGFFSFTLIGLAILFLAILYMVMLGRNWLDNAKRAEPSASYSRSLQEVWQDFQPQREVANFRISSTIKTSCCDYVNDSK